MKPLVAPKDELRGGILAAARVAWVAIAGATALLTAYGFYLRFTTRVEDVLAAAASNLGMANTDVVTAFLVASFTISMLASLFIFVKRSRNAMAILLSLLLTVLAASGTRSLILVYDTRPAWKWGVLVVWGLTGVLFILTMFVFPSGHFVPGWTRWFALGLVGVNVLIPSFLEDIFRLPEVPEGVGTARLTFSLVSFTMFCGIGIAAQVFRYRRHSTSLQRQQTKWVMYGLIWLALSVAGGAALPNLIASEAPGWIGWTLVVVFLPNTIVIPGTILVAVFRNHLYDIDLVINRTLVYGILTGILAGAYVGLVFAFQSFLEPFTAKSDLAIAGSTLAVAALFRPLRTRVQVFIDKRFYRRKFDAQRTLEAFGESLRNEVDLSALSSRLEAVVQDTMQPTNVSLWLREAR